MRQRGRRKGAPPRNPDVRQEQESDRLLVAGLQERTEPGPGPASQVLRASVGHLRWHLHVDFGAGAGLAPDFQLRTDLPGALAHAEQSEVAWPSSRIEYVGVDAAASVADSDIKQRIAVGDLSFNMLCGRVSEGIAERLARDMKDLVPRDRVQLAVCSFNTRAKLRGVCENELFALGRAS